MILLVKSLFLTLYNVFYIVAYVYLCFYFLLTIHVILLLETINSTDSLVFPTTDTFFITFVNLHYINIHLIYQQMYF